MARSRTSKPAELRAQADPTAPLDPAEFLRAAAGVLALLTDDLLARADASPAVTAALQARHAHEQQDQRTSDGYPVWRRGLIVQIAAAWLLSCVFVRTLEDRGLLARNRLAGPGAVDAQRGFLGLAPQLGPAEYLLTIFAELERFPATRGLFDREHNLCWQLAPSPAAARALIDLFRAGDPGRPHFRFGQADTRFLGDLYQDLSEQVRKRHALLQTPQFVESYILDRTLEPAIVEFGLSGVNVIDPTCGSGHFLLGAFERLYARWSAERPELPDAARVHEALARVCGVDINPYAVFIARFRLTLAALAKLEVARLRDAPALPLALVVADSLLHDQDDPAARRLPAGGFAAVVGNPPYITVKDRALRDRYRAAYSAAYREYSLAVPFMQAFFQLARPGGFVGQITANSFMKRNFGKRLIEQFIPTVDLQMIVNTAGAHIPGHGTPTVILFGRKRPPESAEVHAVLARRGEPSPPVDPAQGLVWSAIRDHGDELGYEDEFITVTALPRAKLAVHPWSLEGGGAAELAAELAARAETSLGRLADAIGYMCITKQDAVFSQPAGTFARWRVDPAKIRPFVTGEMVRDWAIDGDLEVWFPYTEDTQLQPLEPADLRALWPFRAVLENRAVFGGQTFEQAGKRWYEYGQIPAGRATGPTIGFAEVATHNHFVLDPGGRIFKQTAPCIKLPADAGEDSRLALLAYLNSSTACFWLKQVCFDKGNRGEGGGTTAEDWERFFQYDGSKLASLPVPKLAGADERALAELARRCSAAAASRAALDPQAAFAAAGDGEGLARALDSLAERSRALEAEIRAAQEQIDWHIYKVFGLCREVPQLPRALEPGERICDRIHAETRADRRYFELCRLPDPEDILAREPSPYQHAALRQIAASEQLALIERPRYKRSYREGFRPKDLRARAQAWLCAALERSFAASPSPQPRTAAALFELIETPAVHAVCEQVLEARASAELIAGLIDTFAIPYLAILRFTPAGLEKHAAWQRTWALQRREDAGELRAELPAPPRYARRDFASASDWRLRGKLDVPRERFIAYPGLGAAGQPLFGWAGWDHAQRAEALFGLYQERREQDGWAGERLAPILAGLVELLPWIKQWHDQPDEHGERLAAAYELFLAEELRGLGLTLAELRAWRPSRTTRLRDRQRR